MAPQYLQQRSFLKLLWVVLAREADIMLCDEHCVHRALCLARVLEDMTAAAVSYDAMGYHGCIQEVRDEFGRRVPQWECRYSQQREFSTVGVFEGYSFSRGSLAGAGVHVEPGHVCGGGVPGTVALRAPGLASLVWTAKGRSRRGGVGRRRRA